MKILGVRKKCIRHLARKTTRNDNDQVSLLKNEVNIESELFNSALKNCRGSTLGRNRPAIVESTLKSLPRFSVRSLERSGSHLKASTLHLWYACRQISCWVSSCKTARNAPNIYPRESGCIRPRICAIRSGSLSNS